MIHQRGTEYTEEGEEIMRAVWVLFLSLCVAGIAVAQDQASKWDGASGMYTFLHGDDTVQIVIQHGKLSGYVTRKEHGTLVDQKFQSALLEGDRMTWSTVPTHGTYYTFEGQLTHDANAAKDKRGFYKIKGTVTVHESGKQQEKQITMQSLPESQQKS